MFENMVLRRIFGPRRDEVTGEWRRLHKKELNDLYSSPNIVRVIKSRRMRWAGHVVCMGVADVTCDNCLLLNCIQPSHVTLHTSDVTVIYHNSFQSHHNYMYSCTFIEFLYNLLYHFVSFIPCYFVGGIFSSDLSPFVSLHSVSAAAHL